MQSMLALLRWRNGCGGRRFCTPYNAYVVVMFMRSYLFSNPLLLIILRRLGATLGHGCTCIPSSYTDIYFLTILFVSSYY